MCSYVSTVERHLGHKDEGCLPWRQSWL